MSLPTSRPPSLSITRRRLLHRAGALSGLGAFCAGLAACSPHRAPSQIRRSSTVRVLDHGAMGDGRTDDLLAIRRALAAVAPGGTVQFDGGRVFCHSDVLTVTTSNIRLIGPGRLLATREATSAVQLRAPGVHVSDLTLGVSDTTRRWSTPDQHKLYLGAHRDISLDDVSIDGSAAAGVFCDGTDNFHLNKVRVTGTRADGVHMTNGAHHGRLTAPRVVRSGDDGVAVVSYLADSGPCHDIVVESPVVATTTGGRGISVVGGHDVRYSDVRLSASTAAAIYIACEGGDFVTSSTSRVVVDGGRIDDANTDAAIDHGAVLVYSGRAGGDVSDVTVQGLTISGTRGGASRQIGVVADSGADRVTGVRFARMTLAGQPTPYQGNAPRASFTLDRVVAGGVAVQVQR